MFLGFRGFRAWRAKRNGGIARMQRPRFSLRVSRRGLRAVLPNGSIHRQNNPQNPDRIFRFRNFNYLLGSLTQRIGKPYARLLLLSGRMYVV